MRARPTQKKQINWQVETGVWSVIEAKQNETKEQKTYLHVPLCIGFKDTISKEQFQTLVNDIESHQKENPSLSFAVVIYSNDHNPEGTSKWLADNQNLITHLKKKNSFFLIEEWRKCHTEERTRAANAYKKICNGNKKSIIEKIQKEDVQRFANAYEVPEEYAVQYLISEVEDCIALMEPKNDEIGLTRLNILYYGGKLYDAISHAIKSCPEELGYKKDSFIYTNHIKYKFNDPVLHPVKSQVATQSTVTHTEATRTRDVIVTPTDSDDSYAKFIATITGIAVELAMGGVGPEYVSIFVASAFQRYAIPTENISEDPRWRISGTALTSRWKSNQGLFNPPPSPRSRSLESSHSEKQVRGPSLRTVHV
jgi:hypothetical protein